MPQYFNDGINDPLVFDSQPIIAGVDSVTRASLLQPTHVSYLQNVDLESSGIAKTRRGGHRLSSRTYGTVHAIKYIKSDDWLDPLFIFGGGNVWMETSTGNKLLAMSAYSPEALPEDCSIAEINGNIFFSDGSGPIVTVSLLGLATDKLIDSNGNYIVTHDGDNIVGFNPVVTMTETHDPTSVRCLTPHKYRLFCAQGVDTLLASKFLPVAGGTSFPDPATTTIRIGKGESDRIVAIVPFKDFRIAIFKEYSIFVVNANPAQDATTTGLGNAEVALVSDKVGCVAEKSAVSVGDDIVFLSRDGVRSIGTTFQQELIATSDPISFAINDQIEKINWVYAHTSVATFWRGRYMLAVPMGSSTVPDTVLVFNTNLKQWTGLWTGWKPTDFEIIELSGQPRKLVWADATNNNVVAFRDWVDEAAVVEDDYTDNLDGTFSTIPFKLLTRAMTFGDPVSPKSIDFMEVEFFRSKSYADITLVPDGGNAIILDSGTAVDTGTGDLRLTFILPDVLGTPGVVRHNMSVLGAAQGREFQILITNTPSERLTNLGISLIDQRFLSIRNINLGGFIDTLEAQI